MKEIFCDILHGFLTQKETVYVQADDIAVEDTGVRLYDEERCVAYFSNEIFRGVYRKMDECIQEIPKEENEEKETREEFFFKYGCECKDPNCSSVVKEKCSAEFFRDLDSVFESHLKAGDLIWREAAIQSLRTAQVNFTVESNINFADYKSEIQQIIDGVIAAQEAAIRKI